MISVKSGFSLALLALAVTGCGWVESRAERRELRAEQAFPPEGRFVELSGGRRVHAVVRGSGPDLVLIHGASGNTRDFTMSFVDRLTDRYRVIVFDRPGLGHTDRAGPEYGGAFRTAAESPAAQADMLHEAALALGATRPVVLGHSYGGAVALAWGLDHAPAALVILSGASEPWPGELGALYGLTATPFGGAAFVPLVSAFSTEGQIDWILEMIFAPQPVPEGYAEDVGAELAFRAETFRANARQLRSLKPHLAAMSERYQRIGISVEIAHGKADRIVPPMVHAVPLSEQVAGANLTLVEGVGHMPHHVVPEVVVAAIDRAARRAGLR